MKLYGRLLITILIGLAVPQAANATDIASSTEFSRHMMMDQSSQPDDHHVHDDAQRVTMAMQHPKYWMVMFNYQHGDMNGLLDGSSSISSADVLARGYMMSPEDMTMDMAMFGLMYMPSAHLHAMVMVPFIINNMTMINQMGKEFSTNAQGYGDTQVKAEYFLLTSKKQTLSATLGVSLPTGTINNTDDTPMGNSLLPYPMQLGSGTVDPIIGAHYQVAFYKWLWQIGGRGLIRTGRNYRGYTLGDQWRADTQLDYHWLTWLSSYAVVDGLYWGKIRGQDPELNPMMSPTANPDDQGGERINGTIGLDLHGHQGRFMMHTLKLFVGTPLYQHLNGPQLKTTWFAGVKLSAPI